MGQIDRHNCEAFFLDYHEGNLSPVQAGEVLLFLEENPDLKNVFEEYENISLEREPITFPGKTEMKKKYRAEGIEALLSSDINSDNCEQFFIAFVEGQLSGERISKLNSFLAGNPDERKEFELFKLSKLPTEKVSFEEKESLKKSLITKENCEEYLIRSAEKDLNRAEEEQLKLFLQKNAEYKKELELFAKAILPSEQILFSDKSSLKKKERKPVFVSIFSQRQTYYAVAAAILLLIGLFFIFRNGDAGKQMLARKTDNGTKTVVNVKKDNVEAPVKQKEQNIAPENKENTNKPEVNDRKLETSIKTSQTKTPILPTKEEKKEEIRLQPVIIEDQENPIAKEEVKPEMMKEEIIVEKKQEEKKDASASLSMTTAQTKTEDYQTIGSFARKKVRQVLGIKKSVECADDKITVWDVAMAAKAKVQEAIGTKAVDVEKVCDSKGDSEYVFTAGNFSISRNAGK